MNDNSTNTNSIKVQISGIRHPEFGEIWGGAAIELELTDKALQDCNASDMQKIKFILPVVAERVTAFVKTMLDREDAQREQRRKDQKEENEALLADWDLRVKEYEERKAAFEKEHKAWEKAKAQAKEDFYEPEPKFYESRPARPHLSVY